MNLSERMVSLRESGGPQVSPLWIEMLPADEALAELGARQGSLFRLQEANVLIGLGCCDEAERLLGGLEGLPPGLEALRGELREKARGASIPDPEPRAPDAVPAGLATRTLAELHATQGDRETAVSMYRQIVRENPSDAGARARLLELLGKAPAGPETALSAWLSRVQRWRNRNA